MKNAAVLPAELMEHCHERHFGQMHSRSQVYLLILIVITGAFAALFFVSVHIIVNANGMLAAPGGAAGSKRRFQIG